MAYVAKSDYTLRISIDHLDEILTQAANTSGLTADEIRAAAELTAQAEVRAYLVSKYKITEELTKSGTARNFLILRWYLDIALYNLHFTVNPRDIPEIRSSAYTAAIEGLKASRDANIVLEIDQVDPFYTRHKLGGNSKFISHEFTDPNLCDN